MADEAGCLTGFVESLPARRRDFDRQVDRMIVQGTLYDRILKHIADREVRVLAQAGLALRTITPELVEHVLAEPCGLRVDSPQQARRLFGLLARLDITEPAGPADTVRHCCDLRTVMLRLSDTARTDLMTAVARRAVQYYAAREGVADRAEEIYHRLRLNENPRAVEERWEDGVERHLDDAAQDMAPRSAAFLIGRLGGYIPDEVLRGADPEDWERITAREVEDLLAQKYIAAADARLAQRPPWRPGSRLHALRIDTLWQSGRRAEARQAAEEAADRAQEAGEARAQLELLRISARLAEEDGDFKEAVRDLDEADDVASRLGLHFDALEALLRRAVLSGDPELVRELADRLRKLPDGALTEWPSLVRAVAAQLAHQDPAALDRVLRVLGLPETGEAVVDALAAAIARAADRQPELGPAVDKILLENAADPPPGPAQESGRPPLPVPEVLRAARRRGNLDPLARRLLLLRDPGGELLSGVADAMGSRAHGRPPADPRADRGKERPRAA